MGFLKKSSAPSELPNLAIESLGESAQKSEIKQVELPIAPPVVAQPVIPVVQPKEIVKETLFSPQIASQEPVSKKLDKDNFRSEDFEKLSRTGFFDKVLEDINVEIGDLGKIEDWYENKFLREDVVSNMKGYWEDNKADIIIQSFGAEYKRQINDKVKILQELEEDWREIYFRLVKKEEEMKKEERELKETLSEFVNLCKRRKNNGEEKRSDKEIESPKKE